MSRFVKLAMIAALVALPTIAMGGDTEIAQSIVKTLKAKKAGGELKHFNIGLRVEEGVVWLEGRVANEQQHQAAIDIARRVQGVQRVVDGIQIEAAAAASEPEAKPVAPAAKPVANKPRELMAADLTKEAGPAAPELVPEPIESLSKFDNSGFSFSPVQPASAEKSVVQPQAAPARMRKLQPVPAHPAVANQTPVPVGGRPGYHYASMNQAGPAPASMPPAYYPASPYGYARPVRYDHPQMPRYAWPAYASYPNYGALTYPRQYSPMAWPYIGPFYPYPQVPLGWRSVEMEWKDGWWTLDFKARRHNSF